MPATSLIELKETLHRLAEALDIAPTAFLDADACEPSQTAELLRIWQGITEKQDREKVLAMVKAITQTFPSRA